MIDSSIFNTEKDYEVNNGSLFLQQEPGLLDSINRHNPEIFALYKKMKSLDWDENEFPFDTCIAEFQTCDRNQFDIMIKTIAWQWEADSVAAHCIAPIVAPFVSSSDLWCAWLRVSDNELVHGLTYSEIVKGSFVDYKATFKAVLEETEAYRRMETIASAMASVKLVAAQLMDHRMSRDDPKARDAIMLFTVALLLLERVQFMSSFAITFAFAEAGMFLPIGKAVQKICNDEFNVHVLLDKAILKNELSLPIGRESFERIKPQVYKMIEEVGNSELRWTREVLFADGRQLVGCNAEMICDWVQFGLTDVYDTLGLQNDKFKIIRKNPLEYMEDWIDLNRNQASPQEEKTGNYLLGGFVNTSDGKVYSVDDL